MDRDQVVYQRCQSFDALYSSFTVELHNRRDGNRLNGYGNMDLSKSAQAVSGREADCFTRNSKTRILLIDDDDLARKTVALMLEQLGYEVLQANNGESGLSLFREAAPPLVITDLTMPMKEGIETLIEIKAERPETRILAISGGGRLHSRNLLTMAQHLGADHTLSKPFGIRELADAVSRMTAD